MLSELALIGGLGLLIANSYWYLAQPGEPRPNTNFLTSRFDRAYVDKLRTAAPDYVLLGNSMLNSRIEPRWLQRKTGKSFYIDYKPAVASAYWYLQIKNVLIPSGVRPKAVFVFFRDNELTNPRFRTNGKYRTALETLAMPDETLLLRQLSSYPSPIGRVKRLADAAFAADVHASRWRDLLAAAPIALWRASGSSETQFLADLNDYFGQRGLRKDLAPDNAEAADSVQQYDFKLHRRFSLLPAMLQLASEHGLRLIFYRVQRRPSAGKPGAVPPELRRYLADLGSYLEANGAALVDETGDPELTLSLYADGDHIDKEHINTSTDVFLRHVRPYLR